MRTLLVVCVALAPAFAAVTVTPPCAPWEHAGDARATPPRLSIAYDPHAPDARLASAQSLNLVIATAVGLRYESATIPMTRGEDGVWRVEWATKRAAIQGLSIFLFEDEKGRVDNNRQQYWDIPDCVNGELTEGAVRSQAMSFEGRVLAPGVQRAPDLARAAAILRDDLKLHPTRYDHYELLWSYEKAPAAAVDAFLDAHGAVPEALHAALLFVESHLSTLPPATIDKLRAKLKALPDDGELVQYDGRGGVYPVSRSNPARAPRLIAALRKRSADSLADLDFWELLAPGGDLRQHYDAFLIYGDAHPGQPRAAEAYSRAFQDADAHHDVGAATAALEKWVAADGRALTLLTAAEFFVNQAGNAARALELVNKAAGVYADSLLPTSRVRYSDLTGRIAFDRGQALALQKNYADARTQLETAVKAAPNDPERAFALGRVCEQENDKTCALAAYLRAAAAPYQTTAAPREAYERLLGDPSAAERHLLDAIAETNQRAAREYTPVPATRPAPPFDFTDLSGRKFDTAAAMGKPAVIVLWSIWCVPCVAELPSIAMFQKQHPEIPLVAVELGHSATEVKAFLAGRHLDGLRVALSAEIPKGFGPGIPQVVVLDRFNQLQYLHAGLLSNVEAILSKDLASLPAPE